MTLLETLIVIGVAVAIIGGIIFQLQRQAERGRNENAVRAQGLEMSQLANAARQYGDTVGETWAEGTLVEVTMAEMIAVGLLPADFGARGDGTVLGMTPLGQRYRVFALKDGGAGAYNDPNVDDGKVRTVILDLETPQEGRLERVGVANLPEAILAFKEAVGLWTATEEKVPMGVLAAGTSEVRGIGRVFTKEVLDWIANPVTTPAAVALVGFPDLDGSGGETGPPGGGAAYCEEIQFIEEGTGCPGGPGSTGSSCAGGYSVPSCPAGFDELAADHLCPAVPDAPKSFGSDVGVVMMGVEVDNRITPPSQVPYVICGTSCTTLHMACGGSNWNQRTGYAEFNGNRIGTIECQYIYASTAISYPMGWGGAPTCAAGASTTRVYPTTGMAQARSKVCCKKATVD